MPPIKLTPEKLAFVRLKLREGWTHQRIATACGVARTTITYARKRKTGLPPAP